MNPGSHAFAAAIDDSPASRSSLTIRSCNVPNARSMQVLGIGRVTAEARVVGGDEPRQPCVRRGNRSSGLTRGYPRQPQLPRLRGGRLLTIRSCNVPNALLSLSKGDASPRL